MLSRLLESFVSLSTAHRPLLPLLLGAGLLAAPAVALAPQDAQLRAVVVYEGAVPALSDLEVLHRLPGVGALVVEGTARELAALTVVPGVRGVSPDAPVAFTSGGTVAQPVAAWAGLASPAGTDEGGAGVRIAVVDTGVTDTPALTRASGRLVDAVDTSTTPNRGPLDDGYGHGTFMASVIAGGPVRDGGQPVGVAPAATVLVVRVAQADGTSRLSQVVRGLDWVARNAGAVDVANLSLSHARPGDAYGADPLTTAVEKVRDAGVTVVVSAGNDPELVGDPGFTPRALTVGAADLTVQQPVVAAFSGSDVVAGVTKPDVVASGVSVLGVLPPRSVIARENPHARVDGVLWRGSGTSQSAAVTSGVAALLLAQDPSATPGQVKAALRMSARPLDDDARDGAGLLQVVGAAADGDADGSLGAGRGDPSGEAGFDANSWSANSWSANSWSANSWSANSWSANSWSASWGGGR